MSAVYDMNANAETFIELQTRLSNILREMYNSTGQMARALEESGSFLAGNQYDKAVKATRECILLTNKSGDNISRAVDYLKALEEKLDEYGRCLYTGNDGE